MSAPTLEIFLPEFRQSAIPDRLSLANATWIEGDAAVQLLAEHAIAASQKGTSFAGVQARRLLDKYDFAADGGWLATGCNLDGSPATVPYFKPANPRQTTEFRGFGEAPKIKTVKYETPQGLAATPILPWVTLPEAIKIANKNGVRKEYEAWILQNRISAQTSDRDRSAIDSSAEDPGDDRGRSAEGFGFGEKGGARNRDSLDKRQHFALNHYAEFEGADKVDPTFWQFVEKYNLPIAITEGLKTALAQIAHGMPAIALRGICNWHPKGEPDLYPVIGHFATKGRQIYIVFDQDEKISTQNAVRTQALKLGAAIEKSGAKVGVCVWDGSRGKGIDDALFALGRHAQTWFNAVFEDALDLATYKRDDRVRQALETIARLNTLSYPVERATEGEYLPILPELQPGALHAIAASVNSGKTTRIGADLVKWAIALGWNVLVLTPINNLGKQSAHDWGLPHVHDYGTLPDQQSALWSDVSHRHGVVLCPDSLPRVPDWFRSRPVLLILDEANQVVEHLTQGDTLKSRYSQILEEFTAAARHAIQTGAIVLAEDGLPDRAVNFVKSVSGCESVRVFTHKKQGVPWDCKVFSGQASGYRARLLEAVATDKRILFVTSSQAEAVRLERALRRRHPDKKVVRIDSETNQQGQFTVFFEQPDQWLQDNQPDVLILSPSAKSGVSIEGNVSIENAYFASVWGYFPVLATDTHWQLLGRDRPSVPRIIFVPDFILSSGDESLLNPRSIKRRLGLNSKAIAGVYGLETLLDEGNTSELQATIETAVLNYLAESKAVSGCQKSIANAALVDRLKKAGHNVECERLAKDGNIVNLWREIQEEIWRDQAAAIGAAKVEAHHTADWALKKLDGLDVSLEIRILAQKVLWRDQFPGVNFDDPEECYQALCKDGGAMRRGVLLQAKAENLEAARESDRKAVEAVLKGNIRALHRLPKDYAKSLLIAKCGVLELLNGEVYSSADPRCQQVKTWALQFKSEISYWLRLQVDESQSAIEICHRLLKKLGLERDKKNRPGAVKFVDRRGKRGQNSERFLIDLAFNPVRTRLLEAARRKLSESVTSIRNTGQDPLIQINVTGQEALPNLSDWLAPESLSQIREQWAAAETDQEREAWRQVIPIEVLERAIA